MVEERDTRYAHELTDVDSVSALRDLILRYSDIIIDARPVVERMTDAEFQEFRSGLKLERRGKFAGEAWAKKYMTVLMPNPMFTISRIAFEYKVPFKVAEIRLKAVRPELFVEA